MTSEYLGKALLEALPRSELQQLAKREGIKANSKSTAIIQGLLKKYPEGVPRNGAPEQSSKPTLDKTIQPKGKSSTSVRVSLVSPSDQDNELLEPPPPKRRKVASRTPSAPAPAQKEVFIAPNPTAISVSGETTSRVPTAEYRQPSPSVQETSQHINGAKKRVSHVGALPDANTQPMPVAEERQYPKQNKRRRDAASDEPSVDTSATVSPPAQRPRKGLSPRKRKLIPSGKEVRLIRRELTEMSSNWPGITEQISEMQAALDDVSGAETKCEKGVGDMQRSVDFLEGYANQFKRNQYLWDGSWNMKETDKWRWEQYCEINEGLKASGRGQMSALMADVRREEKGDPEFWTKNDEEEGIYWEGPGRLIVPRSHVKF